MWKKRTSICSHSPERSVNTIFFLTVWFKTGCTHTHTLCQTRFHQNCLNTLKGHFGYTYRPTKAQNLTDDARTTKRARPVWEKKPNSISKLIKYIPRLPRSDSRKMTSPGRPRRAGRTPSRSPRRPGFRRTSPESRKKVGTINSGVRVRTRWIRLVCTMRSNLQRLLANLQNQSYTYLYYAPPNPFSLNDTST